MLKDIKDSKQMMTDYNYGKAEAQKINYKILKHN